MEITCHGSFLILVLLCFSITGSIDRITHNKSTFLAQREIEYLENAQRDVTQVIPLQSRQLTFTVSTSFISSLRQLDKLGSVEVIGPILKNDVTVEKADTDVSPSPAIRQTPIQQEKYISSSNKEQSSIMKFQPSLPEFNITTIPVTNTNARYRKYTWEGKFRIEMSERHKVTEACCLNSIAVLNNKVVAVCDSPHNSIQLFNGNYERLEEIECTRPRGICTLSNDSFAVSIHGEPIIKQLTVNQLKFSWANDLTISCNTWIRDIKQVGKYIYALCDNSDIHKLELKGKKSSVFPTGLAKHQSRHLCVSKDASRFYVSGEDNVICIDKDGKQIWQYHDSLTKTEGRCLALFDNHILMSDWKNSSLIELSEDGKVTNVVKDIGYPYALCVVEGERIAKAFVTQFSRFVSRETRRCIHIYRIEKLNENANNS